MKLYYILLLSLISCSYPKEQTILIESIENKNILNIKKLLNSETNVEFYYYDGFTPLTLSVKSKCFKCMQLLIEYGANINKPQKGGLSALSWAIVNGDISYVKYLINNGASNSLTCENNGYLTNIELAEKYNRKDILDFFKLHSTEL